MLNLTSIALRFVRQYNNHAYLSPIFDTHMSSPTTFQIWISQTSRPGLSKRNQRVFETMSTPSCHIAYKYLSKSKRTMGIQFVYQRILKGNIANWSGQISLNLKITSWQIDDCHFWKNADSNQKKFTNTSWSWKGQLLVNTSAKVNER